MANTTALDLQLVADNQALPYVPVDANSAKIDKRFLAVTLTDAATIATDCSLGALFRVTLGANRTLGNPTSARDGLIYRWEIIQDATGTRTLSYGAKFAFGTDITGATLSTTVLKRDFLTAIYNAATDKFYVVDFKKGY